MSNFRGQYGVNIEREIVSFVYSYMMITRNVSCACNKNEKLEDEIAMMDSATQNRNKISHAELKFCIICVHSFDAFTHELGESRKTWKHKRRENYVYVYKVKARRESY